MKKNLNLNNAFYQGKMFFKRILLLFILITHFCYGEYQYQLSICSIFRNEAPYLKEWIEFHRLIGIEHFYLCSHNSTDQYKEILMPYIQEGIIELVEIVTPEEIGNNFDYFILNIQCKYYNDCIKQAIGQSKWIAFLDVDEFLFPTQDRSLIEVLKEYDDCVGIGVNWQMFGTSYVTQIQPNQLLIEVLTSCAEKEYQGNAHIKSIVKPEFVDFFVNPHLPFFIDGLTEVNTDRKNLYAHVSPYVQVNKLRINHYWLRDEYYFKNFKIPRRKNWKSTEEELLKYNQELNKEKNSLILRYVPFLKSKLHPKNQPTLF